MRKVTVDTNTNRPRTGYVITPEEVMANVPVPTEVKRNLPPASKEGTILTHMRIEPLRRLTATLISTPDLNSGQRRLGDWVMDELKVTT